MMNKATVQNIPKELFKKAASFVKNHPFTYTTVSFDSSTNRIVFYNDSNMMGWVNFNNPAGGKNYWLRFQKED